MERRTNHYKEHIHTGSPGYPSSNDPKDLQTYLERVPSFRSAFRIGLCNDYPNFDPTDGDKPYDRLPLPKRHFVER